MSSQRLRTQFCRVPDLEALCSVLYTRMLGLIGNFCESTAGNCWEGLGSILYDIVCQALTLHIIAYHSISTKTSKAAV